MLSRRIEVTEYNPEWKTAYKAEAKEIKKILGKNCRAVYHIGSTSVKGMSAKPIIDIMVVVKELSAVDEKNFELESLGYECCDENGIDGRRCFVKGGDSRTHHLHIFSHLDKENIDRHIALREYLRANKNEADAYSALKERLAKDFSDNPEGYCSEKNDFVKELEKKAIEWQKKQEQRAVSMSLGISVGLCFGMSLGSAFGNTGIGMCLGVSIGMCLGLALGNLKKKDGADE